MCKVIHLSTVNALSWYRHVSLGILLAIVTSLLIGKLIVQRSHS